MASFKKHGTGWEFRLKYKDPFTGGFKEKSQRGFDTKKEAQIAAVEFERKIAQGFEQTDITVVQYLHHWIDEYKKGTIRKNTLALHNANIKNHIAPYFKSMMLRDLKPIMYQVFLNHLTEKVYSKQTEKVYSKRTVEIVHSTMHNAMSKAVTIGKLERNPCDGVEIKGKKTKNELKFIDSGDVPKFLQAAASYGYIYWIFFKLLLETGMRKGEAGALQWSDIDFKAQTININKTLDFQAGEGEELFGETKTFNSPRIISITNSLISDLRHHMGVQNQNKLGLQEMYRHDLNLVLCRNDGDIMPKSSLFNSFSRILKRIEHDSLPIHSLRHTHAVMLLEAGADMKYVQERLGHGSMSITADVYAHVSKKLERMNMDRFEKQFGGILGAHSEK